MQTPLIKTLFLTFLAFIWLGLRTTTFAATKKLPSPQKIETALIVKNQEMKKNTIIITRVSTPNDAWVVVRRSEKGKLGTVLGYTFVKKGTNANVSLVLDYPTEVTSQLVAVLHEDKGKKAIYEFPGADIPFVKNKTTVLAPFSLINFKSATTKLEAHDSQSSSQNSTKFF